eukprot:6313364-Pyramimonas_sp.AAC.1
MSTESFWSLSTLKTRARKPYCPSMRVDTMSRMVMSSFTTMEVSMYSSLCSRDCTNDNKHA